MRDNLLRFDNNQKYITIDFETEGLNLQNSRPWEVGFLICRGKKVIESHQAYLWWPDLNVSEEAARITRFDYHKYEDEAQDPTIWFDKLNTHLQDQNSLIIGQNILNFDAFIGNVWAEKIGRPIDYSWINRVIDTRALAVAIQKEKKIFDWNDPLCWQMRYMNHKERGIKASLSFLMKHYGLPYDPLVHHKADEDCKMTFDIFNKQIWEIDI